MSDISFDISWEQGTGGDPLESATYGSLSIRLGVVPLTEVRDEAARTTREVVRVSAYPLAMWLASSWWRLRWECGRKGMDWRLSHQLGGAGSGYVWPDVTFESDGELVHVVVQRPRRTQWEPIVYLTSLRGTVPVDQFEAAVGGFIDVVLARLGEMGHLNSPLSQLWATVQSERRDTAITASRRLESLLGFDAEQAPAELLAAYADGAARFGSEAVAELAAMAANGTTPDWDALSEALESGAQLHIKQYEELKSEAIRAAQEVGYPWQRGEHAARAVRGVLGLPRGPLTDNELDDWLGSNIAAEHPGEVAAALAKRTQADTCDLMVCYRTTHPIGRRFELARLLGDHFIAASPEDSLLAATRAGTARQKVQRAFAAELLLPWEDLVESIGDDPSDEAMETTARNYRVSPLLVRTRLVTKGLLSAHTLDDGDRP